MTQKRNDDEKKMGGSGDVIPAQYFIRSHPEWIVYLQQKCKTQSKGYRFLELLPSQTPHDRARPLSRSRSWRGRRPGDDRGVPLGFLRLALFET
ncbi:hypothetical protein EVAR_77417_1 [Eumeta japonica]|uniref:Uncharacterized protein n=1 Tax=Eumeta variegata TaxID=151549 RepID=A0A4C1UXY7_EUMVA|nr:hypothetical protein EVAR_77417_1 [Eumeta japonica]